MLQYSNLFYFISGAWRQFGRFSQLWLSRVVHSTGRRPCGLTCSSFPRWLHFGSMRGHTTSSSSCWPCHSCRGLTSCVFRMMEERAPPSLQPLTSYIRHQWRRSYLSNFHCGIQWYLVFFFIALSLTYPSQPGHRLAPSHEFKRTRLISFPSTSWSPSSSGKLSWSSPGLLPVTLSGTSDEPVMLCSRGLHSVRAVHVERDLLFRVPEDLRIHLRRTFSVTVTMPICDNVYDNVWQFKYWRRIHRNTFNAEWYVSCSFDMHSEIF